MTEEEIINAIRSGASEQHRALEQLYRFKGAEFKRYFRYKGVPVGTCEDLLQEVIMKIFKNVGDFRGAGAFSDNSANAWMWTIARNCLNDHLQHKQRDQSVIGGSLNDPNWSEANSEAIKEGELSLSHSESTRHSQLEIDLCVTKGLEDFCAEHPDRTAALIMQMDGESIESIARRINRTPAATKQYISQCKIKLKPFIEHCTALLKG